MQIGSCLNVLSTKEIDQSKFDKLNLMWQPKPTTVEITDAEYFFSNKRQSICPMTSCKLLKEDCKTPSTNINIVLSGVWPFNITTNQQSILGYKDDGFCVECMIGDQK